MNLQPLLRIHAIFSHISNLPLHILDPENPDITCLDNGLRAQLKNSAQMYDALRNLFTRELRPGTILHLEDTFGLHYIIFQPISVATFCALGPFVDQISHKKPHFMYLQQDFPLREIPVNSAIDVVRNILALLPEPSSAIFQEIHLVEDSRISLQLTADFDQKVSPTMQQLIYYIQTHLHQKLTLQSLADQFGFSPTYISHHFKDEIGLPPMQYISRQRLLHAQYLLRMKNIPIREIADAVGISDYSYFTKLFREHTGSTPSEYRHLYK